MDNSTPVANGDIQFGANLNGRVAVVLGASAEGGTGWAIAQTLAAHGAKVVVGARSIAPLKALADQIGGTAVECDAGNEQQVEALSKVAIEKYGRLDFAINSAGVSVTAMIQTAVKEDLDTAMRINYYGNFYFIKHMSSVMKSGGSIVIISSFVSTHPAIPFFPYAAAKAATDCLVRYAAMELGPKQIRVNSILPGPIMTNMTKDVFSDPAMLEAQEHEIPLGRIGYPQDHANAVLWLCGPSFVTGLNLHVNGGNHLTRLPYPSELPNPDARNADRTKPLGDR